MQDGLTMILFESLCLMSVVSMFLLAMTRCVLVGWNGWGFVRSVMVFLRLLRVFLI